MKKEKVFIVVTQIRSLKPRTRETWQVTEKVEFVNEVRNKHIQTAYAIGDYMNQKMILGMSKGMDDYKKFEEYIRIKYSKQVDQLDSYFRPKPESEPAVDDRAVSADGENIVVVE